MGTDADLKVSIRGDGDSRSLTVSKGPAAVTIPSSDIEGVWIEAGPGLDRVTMVITAPVSLDGVTLDHVATGADILDLVTAEQFDEVLASGGMRTTGGTKIMAFLAAQFRRR